MLTKVGRPKFFRLLLVAVTTIVLSACGGGSSNGNVASDPANNNPQASNVTCDGTRSFDFGLDAGDTTKTLISAGGATFGVPPDSKTPCAVYWEVNEAQTCSLIFSVEEWFTEYTNMSAPPADLNLALSGNKLTARAAGETNIGNLSQLTTEQLRLLPNC